MRKPQLPLKCLACRNSGFIVAKGVSWHTVAYRVTAPSPETFRVPCECAVGKRFATDAEFRKAR